MWVDIGDPQGDLVHIGFPQEHAPGSPQPLHRFAILSGHVTGVKSASRVWSAPSGFEQILERQRQPVQRPTYLPLPDLLLGLARALQRVFSI